jgi:hypothetical protein
MRFNVYYINEGQPNENALVIDEDAEINSLDLYVRIDSNMGLMRAHILSGLIGNDNYKSKPVHPSFCAKVIASREKIVGYDLPTIKFSHNYKEKHIWKVLHLLCDKGIPKGDDSWSLTKAKEIIDVIRSIDPKVDSVDLEIDENGLVISNGQVNLIHQSF